MDRRSAPILVWLLPTVVTAAVAVTTASVAAAGARAGVLWCGVVGTAAVALVAAEAARRGRALVELRERSAQQEDELRRRLARQQAETSRLASEVLPESLDRMHRGESIDSVVQTYEFADRDPFGRDFTAARGAVMRYALDAIDNEESLRDSTQRAFVNIARRVQAIVHRQARDLRAMEDKHGSDPAVFTDLLTLDHGNALIGRLADSIAVLGGARPGRQWNRSVALYSVLRGGMSRILDYQRVDLHPVADVAVVGPAVEPLIHAVAELLDNATRYSPPQTRVHLSAAEVQTGMAIEIEDGGISLSEEGRARAERTIREAQTGVDLNDLGETPRLGLSVVGRLAKDYGFQVSLRHSAYGGVRAILVVPMDLITSTPPTAWAHGIGVASGPRSAPSVPPPSLGAGRTAGGVPTPPGTLPWGPETLSSPTAAPNSRRRATSHRAPARPAAGSSAGMSAGSSAGMPTGMSMSASGSYPDDEVVVTEWTSTGLPQRRRHAAPATYEVAKPGGIRSNRTPEPAGEPEKDPVQPGLWLSAFYEGLNGHGPSSGGSSPNGSAANGSASGGSAANGSASGGSYGQTSEESSGKGEQ